MQVRRIPIGALAYQYLCDDLVLQAAAFTLLDNLRGGDIALGGEVMQAMKHIPSVHRTVNSQEKKTLIRCRHLLDQKKPALIREMVNILPLTEKNINITYSLKWHVRDVFVIQSRSTS
jgi:hypothetical protein